MQRIMISYRRDDSLDITGRIHDRLAGHFGREAVFRDIDNIPVGVDFRHHIDRVLDESDIILAIVGPRWIGPNNEQLRLASPDDRVRLEIETALLKDKLLIPVLVSRAVMPQPDVLPVSLHDFAYRNALQVDSGPDFDVDVSRLIRAIERLRIHDERAAAEAVQGVIEAIEAAPSTEPTPKAEPPVDPLFPPMDPSAPRPRRNSANQQPRAGRGGINRSNRNNGPSELTSLPVLERFLNSGPTGVGFGLITLGISAVRLDQYLGYGLSIGGFAFVALSVLPKLISSSYSYPSKPTDVQITKRPPYKLLGGLFVTLSLGAFLLFSEITGPSILNASRNISSVVSRGHLELCPEFQKSHAETAACNKATAPGYYWKVGTKLTSYGITMPAEADKTEPVCDAGNINAVATTYRFPATMATWATVITQYNAANGGAGGDPECQYSGAGEKVFDVRQGYRCGVFQAICTKQP